jgi:hypothetical protein
MKNVIINNIPSANRKNFGYKSINRSDEHNENQNEILADILDLYNKTNAIERLLNRNMDFIKEENTYLTSLNKDILTKYNDLLAQYEEFKNNATERRLLITPASCTTDDRNYGAVIDTKTSSITKRPTLKVSKFVIFDEAADSVYLPDTLNVTIINEDSKGIITESDNDIYSPFYKDENLYWTRRVVTDTSVEKLTTNYVITLPEEIMTTPLMNELYINPFLCRVTKVYCRYGDSAAWDLIDGLDYNPATANAGIRSLDNTIECIRPFKLNFESRKINQIKITVEASRSTEVESNYRTFLYGLKEVTGFINYYSDYETSSFEFETKIPDTDGYEITGIKPYFNNGSDSSMYYEDFNYDFYYKDNDDEYHKITDTFPFTPATSNIKVKCIFGESYDEMNLRKIEIIYKKNS